MFTLIIPDEAEKYKGVPLVHLPDDAADIAALLNFLYHPATLVFKKYHPDLPLIIAGPLRIAKKYLIDSLVHRFQQQFLEDWPKTAFEWETLEGEIDTHKRLLGCDFYGSMDIIDDSFPEPASAIKFAREFDLPQILPAAFYHLARIETTRDWDVLRVEIGRSLDRVLRSARWNLLSREDLFCLTRGREYLIREMKMLQELISPRADSGLHDEDCCRERFLLLESKFTQISPYDVLRCYRIAQALQDNADGKVLCLDCRDTVVDYFIDREADVWNGLRGAFGLPAPAS